MRVKRRCEEQLLRYAVLVVPIVLAIYATCGLWNAYMDGGVYVCKGATRRPALCHWITPSIDAERFQTLVTSNWVLLGLSVVLAGLLIHLARAQAIKR
jgi:hypothetical protein